MDSAENEMKIFVVKLKRRMMIGIKKIGMMGLCVTA